MAGLGAFLALAAASAFVWPVFAFDGSAKVINAAVFGGLFLLGCLLLGLGTALSPVTSRLFWYSGGLVQLTGDEPEPRVLRWADVETVITLFEQGNRPQFVLTGCILRDGTGTDPIDISSGRHAGTYPQRVLRKLAVEAATLLAPRLVPPLIESYEAGEPVIVGRARVDRSGITTDPPYGWRIAWSEIHSIATQDVGRLPGIFPIHGISISEHAQKARPLGISLGEVPNGMFVPHLIAYAAAQNGIPLWTRPRISWHPGRHSPGDDARGSPG